MKQNLCPEMKVACFNYPVFKSTILQTLVRSYESTLIHSFNHSSLYFLPSWQIVITLHVAYTVQTMVSFNTSAVTKKHSDFSILSSFIIWRGCRRKQVVLKKELRPCRESEQRGIILWLFQFGAIVYTVSNVRNYLWYGVMATAQTLIDVFKNTSEKNKSRQM